jgi:hypothetical protein
VKAEMCVVAWAYGISFPFIQAKLDSIMMLP